MFSDTADHALLYHAEFSESQEKQEFFLMEIDALPTNQENEDPTLGPFAATVGFIKGGIKENAVFCTDTTNSYLVSHENSNSSFVATKIDDELHIVCDLSDVIISKESAPIFSTAIELLKNAPLGSDSVVTWHDLQYNVPASERALQNLLKHPSCVPCGPVEWQWMSPDERYAVSDALLQIIVAEGFKETVPIDAMLERVQPFIEKLGNLPKSRAEAVVHNCLQADICDVNSRVDYDKIALFCARSVLHLSKKMSLEQFQRRWQSKLPVERGMDCLKPPLYVFKNEIFYIDEIDLSHDPIARLKYLFQIQKKWHPDLLEAAISPALTGNATQWLMKNARFVNNADEKYYYEKFVLS